jgi:hypothetical protein
MTRLVLLFGLLLGACAGAALGEEPPACSLNSFDVVNRDKSTGEAMIGCAGLSEAAAKQFAEILTRILQERLDPGVVLVKLSEVDRLPQAGAARTVDEDQRQAIVQYLNGKPPGQLAIIAHPLVADAAELARSLATPLLMAGWQIEGQQIRRAAPKGLDPVQGITLVVRDRTAPPAKALQLKAALAAARVTAALVSDPAAAQDTVVLWVGRPLGSADAAK